MSIGQRIAQKRKELGLSQEALGEQLNISRQAIYKWESDSALPEIEKLVALSKLFGVSVGWLLGVEEQERTGKNESSSVTPEQMELLEQIVKRYTEAQPMPKPRRKWPWIMALCVLGIVFAQLFGQIEQLSSQYTNLQNSVSNISYSVNSQISGIAGRVEAILKAQNHLTAEYCTEIVRTDLARNTVTIAMEAVPRTYGQGMSAVFVVDCGNGPKEFEGILENNTTFTCEAEVELTDGISAYVVFVSFDGTRQTQLLDTYYYMLSDSYARLSIHDEQLKWKRFTDGKMDFHGMYVSAGESGPGKGGAKIAEYKLGLFHNQKLLGWAEPCPKPDSYMGDDSGMQFFQFPDMIVTDMKEGDIFTVAALVTDSYGRQYMCYDIPYEVKLSSDGKIMELEYVSAVEDNKDLSKWIFD